MKDCNDCEAQGWHLDKKVPVGLIVALITQGIAGIWAIADIKKDVEVLKSQAVALDARDNRMALDMKESMAIVREQLAAIHVKIDRLVYRK